MKKLLSVILICLFVIGIFSLPAVALNNKASAKISTDFGEALEVSQSAKALVVMKEIDHLKVMQQFMTQYPLEHEAYMMAKFDVSPTSNQKITDVTLQNALEVKRALYRQHYGAANKAIIQDLVEAKDIDFISEYSPVAVVELSGQQAIQLAKNDSIVSISATPSYSIAPEVDQYRYGQYDTDAIIDGIVRSNQISRADYVRDVHGNSGAGVKVGIVEASGIPDIDDPYLEHASIYLRSETTVENDHATAVACVLVGQTMTENYGLVPDATLYCSSADEPGGIYGAVEWLINQGVNVINASLGATGPTGTYNSSDAWMDHIAVMHDVHFVKSAGNNGAYVTAPGMAYNAITVGGFDANNSTSLSNFTMWDDSSYEESSDGPRAEKPNLVANAVLKYTSSPYDTSYSGTSYAAPQAAGTIAQLCSYNSALKYKQTAVGAILMASSARKVEATGTGEKGDTFSAATRVEGNPQISDLEGAGILDAQWARGIALQQNFWSPTIYSASFPYTKTVTIDAATNTVSRVAIFWLSRVSVTDHASSAHTSIPVANLNLSVYDPNNNLVGSSSSTYANFEIVQFVPSVTGTYRIVISGASTEKEYVGIAVW